MFYINRNSVDELLNNSEYAKTAWNHLERLYEYASYVMKFENKMKMIQVTAFDTEDFQNRVKNLDEGRRLKHEAAISSLSVLNKIAERINVDCVYEGTISIDPDYRGEIATAIFEFCKQNLDLDKYGILEKK